MIDGGGNERHVHGGRLGFESSSSSACTALDTLTSEAPLALKTPKAVAGRPLSRAMERTSRDAVAHVRYFAQAKRSPAARHDLRLRQILRRLRAAQYANRLLASSHLRPAARGVEIQRAQLIVDFDRRQAQCLQARRIELARGFPD